MKRFAKVALLAAMMFGFVASASAGTELKVKGSYDVNGLWSQNLKDFNSDTGDADNYSTAQRMRTYFTYQSNQNLKAVLGLEIDNIWGQGIGADWGTDGTNSIEVKHAYLDFTIPETVVNITAGLQPISLPSVFGNPVFDDDAAALVISAPITDVFGLSVGYTRGADNTTNYSANPSDTNDNVDMFFIAAPVTLNGLAITPYAAYASVGNSPVFPDQEPTSVVTNSLLDSNIWVAGANAKLTMFDPFTVAADLIYGQGKNDDYTTKGWYAALAGSYKFDMLTATLFGTYATGAKDDADKDNYLPTLAEGWGLTPYVGGVRAFNIAQDSFSELANDGTGVWSVGLKLTAIQFVEKLSHDLTIAYVKGTSDEDARSKGYDGFMSKEDSAWEIYMVNKYMIFENLAAINELGYFAPNFSYTNDEDNSAFMSVGLQYQF